MLRRGVVRGDGKIFWAYRTGRNKKRYEIWVTKQKFDNYESARLQKYHLCMKKYKESQAELPVDERNSFGKYNSQTGLYFIRLSSKGAPIFGTLEELQTFKIQKRQQQKNWYAKIRSCTPLPTVCLGDQHPSDPNLFVVEIRNHKVKYGTLQKLQDRRNKLKKLSREYRQKKGSELTKKYREIRQVKQKERKENPHLKFRRGDINPITNHRFWGYSTLGNEIWLSNEEFIPRRIEYNKKRLEYYHAKKSSGNKLK